MGSSPGLPLYLMGEGALLSIASATGRLLFIDQKNLEQSKVGYVSFCVALDVSLVHPKALWIQFLDKNQSRTEGFKKRIIFGDIPAYCQGCSHLGHGSMNCKKVGKFMSNSGQDQRDGDSGRNDTPAMVVKKGVEGRHIQVSKAADGAYITEVIEVITKGIQEEDLAVDKPIMAAVVEQVFVGDILGCVDVDADTGKTSTLEMEEVDLRSSMESDDSLKAPSVLDVSYKGACIDKRADFYKGVAQVSTMLVVKELTKTHSAYHQEQIEVTSKKYPNFGSHTPQGIFSGSESTSKVEVRGQVF